MFGGVGGTEIGAEGDALVDLTNMHVLQWRDPLGQQFVSTPLAALAAQRSAPALVAAVVAARQRLLEAVAEADEVFFGEFAAADGALDATPQRVRSLRSASAINQRNWQAADRHRRLRGGLGSKGCFCHRGRDVTAPRRAWKFMFKWSLMPLTRD